MSASSRSSGAPASFLGVAYAWTLEALWSGADEVAEMDGAGNILRRFISGVRRGGRGWPPAPFEANGAIFGATPTIRAA
ncbi:hypothetical protein [Brevundimonas naejangsanensis]|nr:hypothetical protein [Brevundimonas naejangsanensis]